MLFRSAHRSGAMLEPRRRTAPPLPAAPPPPPPFASGRRESVTVCCPGRAFLQRQEPTSQQLLFVGGFAVCGHNPSLEHEPHRCLLLVVRTSDVASNRADRAQARTQEWRTSDTVEAGAVGPRQRGRGLSFDVVPSDATRYQPEARPGRCRCSLSARRWVAMGFERHSLHACRHLHYNMLFPFWLKIGRAHV